MKKGPEKGQIKEVLKKKVELQAVSGVSLRFVPGQRLCSGGFPWLCFPSRPQQPLRALVPSIPSSMGAPSPEGFFQGVFPVKSPSKFPWGGPKPSRVPNSPPAQLWRG